MYLKKNENAAVKLVTPAVLLLLERWEFRPRQKIWQNHFGQTAPVVVAWPWSSRNGRWKPWERWQAVGSSRPLILMQRGEAQRASHSHDQYAAAAAALLRMTLRRSSVCGHDGLCSNSLWRGSVTIGCSRLKLMQMATALVWDESNGFSAAHFADCVRLSGPDFFSRVCSLRQRKAVL